MVSAGVTGLGKDVFASAVSASKNAVKAAGADFGIIMSQSLSRADSSTVNTAQKQDFSKIKTDAAKAQPTEEKAQPIEEKAVAETERPQAAQQTEKAQTDQTKEAQAEPETEEGLEEGLSEKIQALLENVKEELKSRFNLTDEQIESVLAQLGMQLQDLLGSNELTQFVAAATGQESVIDLLTQGDLTENLKAMIDFIAVQTEAVAEEMKLTPQEVREFAVEEFVPQQIVQSKPDVVEEEKPGPQAVLPEHQNLAQVLEEKISTVQPTQNHEQMKQSDSGQKEKDTSHTGIMEKHFTQTVAGQMTQHIEEAFSRVVGNEVQPVSPSEIIRQIIESVKVTAVREIAGMEIQLNPEHLGKINLSVIAKNGVVTAQIATENETVKRAIEAQMATLKDNFSQQGIKVEAVEVTVASHSFESNAGLQKGNSNEQANGGQRRRSLKLDGLEDFMTEELSEDEQQAANPLNENSSVEYTA